MTEEPPEARYIVKVITPEKSPPTPKQFVQELKGVVGGKQLARMKKEAVDCPVLANKVSIAQCSDFPNFFLRLYLEVVFR
jgi:hypothetical protein